MQDNLYDEAALLGAIGSFITGMVVLWRQGRHRKETARNAVQLQSITDTLNHTDQEVSTADGPQTLGQRVVQLQRTQDSLKHEVVEGFDRNDKTHDMLTDGLHQIGGRVDQIRRDLNDTNGRITHLHPEDEEDT